MRTCTYFKNEMVICSLSFLFFTGNGAVPDVVFHCCSPFAPSFTDALLHTLAITNGYLSCLPINLKDRKYTDDWVLLKVYHCFPEYSKRRSGVMMMTASTIKINIPGRQNWTLVGMAHPSGKKSHWRCGFYVSKCDLCGWKTSRWAISVTHVWKKHSA